MSTLTITIGDTEYPGKLPHMRTRLELWLRYRKAMGYEDSLDGDEAEDMTEEAKAEAVAKEDEARKARVDVDDIVSLALAAIGLCWAGDPLEIPSYRVLRRQLKQRGEESEALFEYGEHVFDALYESHKPQELHDAGYSLILKVYESIPTKAEVEEATDFTEGPAAPSTATM